MKVNILIVDDIEDNLYFLGALLEELEIDDENFEGLNIFKAQSGKEALDITSKENIDLVLLDIIMPQMNGFEVAKFLKSQKSTSHIPIVFLTAEFKSEEFVKEGYEIGAIDYFTKPIEAFQFLNRMRLYIELFLSKKVQKKKFDDTLSGYMNLIDKYIVSSDTDIHGKITRVSQAFCDVSGYTEDEIIGKTHSLVRSPDVSADLYKELWSKISQDKQWKGQIKNKTKSGKNYWVDICISPLYDENNNKIGYTSVKNNITNRKYLEKISITDGLTSLFNRRYFNEIAPKIINSAKRDDKLICFALIDIDYFKKYNDTYGHQKGDKVIQEVARMLGEHTHRASDYCFRIGGEEFCIIFNAQNAKKAFNFMIKLKDNIENLKIEHKKSSASKYITISMGLYCEEAKQIEDLQSLYKKTDELLYKAKKQGKNKVVSNTDENDYKQKKKS